MPNQDVTVHKFISGFIILNKEYNKLRAFFSNYHYLLVFTSRLLLGVQYSQLTSLLSPNQTNQQASPQEYLF